jgi:hypothetical protein
MLQRAAMASKELYSKGRRYLFSRAARSGTIRAANPVPETAEKLPRHRMRFSTPERSVSVKTEAARYPEGPTWPLQMRADMTAAILDFRTTKELCHAIANGQAPYPTAFRLKGGKWEAIWSTENVREFVLGKRL